MQKVKGTMHWQLATSKPNTALYSHNKNNPIQSQHCTSKAISNFAVQQRITHRNNLRGYDQNLDRLTCIPN
jgi:hypothetical protein